MIGDGLTALFLGVGVGTWMYARLMKTTNSPQNSLVGAAVVGLIGFIVVYTLLKYMLHY